MQKMDRDFVVIQLEIVQRLLILDVMGEYESHVGDYVEDALKHLAKAINVTKDTEEDKE